MKKCDILNRYVWWSVGSLLFLVVALRLNAVVQESEARISAAAHDVLKTLSMIVTAMWMGYPLMILLGADGVGAIPTKAELGCLTLLDLSAKVRVLLLPLRLQLRLRLRLPLLCASPAEPGAFQNQI